MSYLLDDVARSLASPSPRRRVLRLIGGALAGVLFGTLGLEKAAAAGTCNNDNAVGCNGNQTCCDGYGNQSDFCIGQKQHCCANTYCVPPRFCCGTGATAVCCNDPNDCNTNTGRCFASRS